MKKLTYFCLLAVLFAFSSCESRTEVDVRDAFVGAYAYVATGSISFDFGITKYNVPLDAEGTFTISKEGEENKVVITGWNDPIYGTISGNQIILDSNQYETNYEGIALHMLFSYGKATLADNRLTWNTDVSSEARYSSFAATGSGTVSMVATKK